MSFLKHSVNGQLVNIFELKQACLIGRKGNCHIQLEDPTVSATHAQFVQSGELWVVKDQASTNGILVNGKKVQEAQLQEGSVVTIGTHDFEFLLTEPGGLDKTLRIKKSWIPGVYYTE
jgi:pSer/pThr/pTyr-binding forkhead associated (FHA) protein